jgi:RNA polymerase sigma-70 factor (ECF subfamily)
MAAMHDPPPTDAELVALSRQSDTTAFGQLYDRYARLVCVIATSHSPDASLVADLVQETFLRAYRRLAELRQPERFGAWVAGIARHVARERRRSTRRDRHEFVDGRTMRVASGDELRGIDEADETRWILRQISELDEREQLAIHTFYLKGRDVARTAEILGLSRSGTYALVARAIARLAQKARNNETLRGAKR